MQPVIHLNWLAIVVSIIASFAIGAVWYGPLFGRAWARGLGFPDDMKPSGSEIARAFTLNLLGIFLMAYVLAHNVLVWRPSTWSVGVDATAARYGFFAPFSSWLGFMVPLFLNAVAFERKSWTVTAIGAGYQLISLIAMGMILAYWQ